MSEKYINISLKFPKIDIHLDTGLQNEDSSETIKVLFMWLSAVCVQEGQCAAVGNFVQDDQLAFW